jgi:hypothetical protein
MRKKTGDILVTGPQRSWINLMCERKYEDMSATEQQILEDFDTHKSRKEHDEACAKRLPPFRGSLL